MRELLKRLKLCWRILRGVKQPYSYTFIPEESDTDSPPPPLTTHSDIRRELVKVINPNFYYNASEEGINQLIRTYYKVLKDNGYKIKPKSGEYR